MRRPPHPGGNRLRAISSGKVLPPSLDAARNAPLDQPPGFALFLLPLAPAAAARAAANALPVGRGPIDVLSTSVLLLVVVVAIARTLIRRSRVRRDDVLLAHTRDEDEELLRVPVSEMAMFDSLREEGDQRKLEDAWRELVARKRAEREKRIQTTLAQQDEGVSLSLLANLDGRRLNGEQEAASWTAVKAAAAEINGQRGYLGRPADVALGGGSRPGLAYDRPAGLSGFAPTAPGARRLEDRRFPPVLSVYTRPAAPSVDIVPSDEESDVPPVETRLGPGALAQRFASSAASASSRSGFANGDAGSKTLRGVAERARSLGAGSRAADMRALSFRNPEPAYKPEPVLAAPLAATLVSPAEPTGPTPPHEAFDYDLAAEAARPTRARAYAAAVGGAAGSLLKLPVVAAMAFVKALVEPLPPQPRGQLQPQQAAQPSPSSYAAEASSWYSAAQLSTRVESPPPVQLPQRPPVAAAPRAYAPPQAVAATPLGAASMAAGMAAQAAPKPASSWDILSAKHAQLEKQLAQRGNNAAQQPPSPPS
ncbi:hypothetical protein T492DRAFT_957180 [Pavlovales sp. CCMP2436]|nr:hypothetical protein T492DRAFT_957180 [Pavlovales sp. CCMP2436]